MELVSEGDSVNELFIVVSGQLSSYRTSNLFNPEVSSCCGQEAELSVGQCTEVACQRRHCCALSCQVDGHQTLSLQLALLLALCHRMLCST